MNVARFQLAPVGETAGFPHEPPSPTHARTSATVLSRARHVGRGGENLKRSDGGP
jgi:hypothetical protein